MFPPAGPKQQTGMVQTHQPQELFPLGKRQQGAARSSTQVGVLLLGSREPGKSGFQLLYPFITQEDLVPKVGTEAPPEPI